MTQRFWYRTIFLQGLLTLGLAAGVQAQEACFSYVVQPGDTLGSISTAAYGRLDYQTLFNANADLLRESTTELAAGTELRIPCEDGRLTETDVVAPIGETAPSAVAADTAAGTYRPTIRFAAGNDWFPFADERLTGGGFLIRLVSTSMNRAGNDHPYRIEWVDDWGSHLTVLLPTGASDISVAWYQPDCDNLDLVSEFTRDLCQKYIFSDSLYDAVFGFFARKDNPYAEAKTFADLMGANICRPEGYSYHDLDKEGLIEPAITLSIPSSTPECFQGIADGTYDIATVESQAAYPVIDELGIGDVVVENPRIASVQAIAAMGYKTNPRALEYMTYLNRGLTELRDSGEWDTIISSSLKEAFEMSLTE